VTQPLTTHGLPLEEVHIDGCRLTEVTHRPALCIPPHEHDAFKVCILLEGAFTERDGLNIHSPGAMELLVRGSRRPHANQYGGRGARSLLLEIPPDHRSARDLSGVHGMAQQCPETQRAAVAVVRAFRRQSDRPLALRLAMRCLLASFEGCRGPPPPAWLDRLREYLAEHWAEPLRLNQLAALVGVHPVYLSQAFRHHSGQTLSAYARALRLFHATELLRSSANLSAIAVECGFFDQSHFTHAFEIQHQIPPGLYRKALSENELRP